jgi:isocitrate/isopropylmalate dehydrogenase
MTHHIVTLPGDGIGPEIMAPTLELLSRFGDFEFEEHPFGGASIDAHGVALTDDVLDACRHADAVLLAAVEVGYHRSPQAPSRAGSARSAQGPRIVRQPAAGQAVAGAV